MLTFSEEYGLRVLRKIFGPDREKITAEWRKQHKEFHQTCLLTPWRRVLLDKLTSSQLVKKFPALYRTRRFTTAFTSASHLSLP
jgi:hypothetical protein